MRVRSPLSLADSVDRKLKPIYWGAPILGAVLFSILFGISNILIHARSNHAILRSLSPIISSLLETGDRPELQRVVNSVGEAQGVEAPA